MPKDPDTEDTPEAIEPELVDTPEEPAHDETTSQADVEADLDAVAAEIEALRDQTNQLTDKLARARADYDNLQRRVERDGQLERERAKARIIEGFLQVFEYSQMAAKEAEKHPGPLAQGVLMVVREFERLLENEGVRQFGAVGEPFDAACHEAVATEEAEGATTGQVSRVVTPGYRLGDRVLRYARVAVAP